MESHQDFWQYFYGEIRLLLKHSLWNITWNITYKWNTLWTGGLLQGHDRKSLAPSILLIVQNALNRTVCIYYRSWYSFSLANRWNAPIGSEPVLRMNTRGVEGEISVYRVARSTGGFSTNCCPKQLITNSVTANTTWKQTESEIWFKLQIYRYIGRYHSWVSSYLYQWKDLLLMNF